ARWRHLARLRSLSHAELEAARSVVDRDLVSLAAVAGEQLHGELVLNLALDQPLQRPGPVARVVSLVRDMRAGAVGQHDPQLALREPLLELPKLDVHDPRDVLAAERFEHHDLVDAVDELRTERRADLRHDLLPPGLPR